ncbi:uncharacterized protein LOC104886512 isoform X2 [Beta vulgaris subsp. vulgaris]|uniref:uncharacterized protein LOC104886512 isoform X2 n=1 Tax=Beta vulgaris subsp. vulgaris TaxID=3555 RepID=UPI0025497B42|nr:uncharacterized protein LOC104886512 isoform X2 [Beta vulgaris subsp. vulgaris]
MKDAQEELYPGCKTFSRLEFIVTLLQLKVSGRWSDKSFNGLLNALHKAFNYDVSFPKISYEAKKYTKDLGLNYVKIHRWRNDKKSFGGERERRPPPVPLSGDEILEAFEGVPNVIFGKKRKRNQRYLFDQWKKLSVFYRLPYWSKLLIGHNLDVMHIEKNICDSIIGTVLDIPGKNNKDHLNARRDLKMMKMHEKLLPEKVDRGKYIVPRAPYQLTPQER